jgi:hypothetical protein
MYIRRVNVPSTSCSPDQPTWTILVLKLKKVITTTIIKMNDSTQLLRNSAFLTEICLFSRNNGSLTKISADEKDREGANNNKKEDHTTPYCGVVSHLYKPHTLQVIIAIIAIVLVYALFKFFQPKHPLHSVLCRHINIIRVYYCNGISVSHSPSHNYMHFLYTVVSYLNHVRNSSFDCYIFRLFKVFIISGVSLIFLFSNTNAEQCVEAN